MNGSKGGFGAEPLRVPGDAATQFAQASGAGRCVAGRGVAVVDEEEGEPQVVLTQVPKEQKLGRLVGSPSGRGDVKGPWRCRAEGRGCTLSKPSKANLDNHHRADYCSSAGSVMANRWGSEAASESLLNFD